MASTFLGAFNDAVDLAQGGAAINQPITVHNMAGDPVDAMLASRLRLVGSASMLQLTVGLFWQSEYGVHVALVRWRLTDEMIDRLDRCNLPYDDSGMNCRWVDRYPPFTVEDEYGVKAYHLEVVQCLRAGPLSALLRADGVVNPDNFARIIYYFEEQARVGCR